MVFYGTGSERVRVARKAFSRHSPSTDSTWQTDSTAVAIQERHRPPGKGEPGLGVLRR